MNFLKKIGIMGMAFCLGFNSQIMGFNNKMVVNSINNMIEIIDNHRNEIVEYNTVRDKYIEIKNIYTHLSSYILVYRSEKRIREKKIWGGPYTITYRKEFSKLGFNFEPGDRYIVAETVPIIKKKFVEHVVLFTTTLISNYLQLQNMKQLLDNFIEGLED